MSPRWRKGLSGATGLERAALLRCEREASQMALATECNQRCAQHPLGLADCADIEVLRTRLRWFRLQRHIYAVIACDMNVGGTVHIYRWRLSQADLERLASPFNQS
jgi:hypothetical protein